MLLCNQNKQTYVDFLQNWGIIPNSICIFYQFYSVAVVGYDFSLAFFDTCRPSMSCNFLRIFIVDPDNVAVLTSIIFRSLIVIF